MTRNIKIKEQLGISSGAANYKLHKDIIWYLIEDKNCYRCKLPMTRETFSIEHKINWLNSENPKDLFFDLNNITFSHLKCNMAPENKTPLKLDGCGHVRTYWRGCRCEDCTNAKVIYDKEYNRKRNAKYKHDPQKRKLHYKKYGV